MRRMLGTVLTLTFLVNAPSRADDAADARAIVAESIAAMGGQAKLSKFKGYAAKIKGEIHTQAIKIPFTGTVATQGADQQKIALELQIDGQKTAIVQVLNRSQGWVKANESTNEMDMDKLAQTLEEAHAGWVASLVPLKDKAFTLSKLADVQVDGKPAVGMKVSHAGRRDVELFFDKKTHLLVKTETRVKDEEKGQEVTQESFLSSYDGKDVKQALKLTIKRNGSLYLEAELSDVKLEEKLDDSVFAKP